MCYQVLRNILYLRRVNSMSTTKLRKQGSSIVVTIPAAEAKNLDMDREYIVKTDKHGTITLIPQLENPFKNAEKGEFYEEDEWAEMKPIGKEIW